MISVIVPSYNVEPYLRRCVNSIINQTYKDLEVILVNDGSTDRTGELCDEMARIYKRIKVVHKENGGLSDARNAGIYVAGGEFYSFIDGDDFIEPDTYETMVAEMESPDVSIVAGGFFVTDLKGNTSTRTAPERQKLTRKQAFMDLFVGENYLSQSSCNKLFRSSLFENVRYKKGIINEDMEILPRLLDVSDNIVLLDKAVYHYIKKEGSITSSDYSMERYNAIEIERNIYNMCKSKYPELAPYAGFYELKSLYGMLCNLMECGNRKEFGKQEMSIRWKIISASVRCMRWKEIRNDYRENIKTFFMIALIGNKNVKRMAGVKQKICGIIKRK